MLISVIIIIALTGLDQLTKHLATVYLAPVGAMPFIPGVMELRYVLNDGAAFSLLSGVEGGRVILLVFTGIAVSVLNGPAPECASIIQGTIAAAAVINEIIAVFMAKKGFEWAGELHQAERNP